MDDFTQSKPPYFLKEQEAEMSNPKWEARFLFEFIEWMEDYYEETGHYPPPMRCYNYIMQKLK